MVKLDLPQEAFSTNSQDLTIPLNIPSGLIPMEEEIAIEGKNNKEQEPDEELEEEDEENEITNIDDLLIDEDVELSPKKPPVLPTLALNGEVFAEDEDMEEAEEEDEEEEEDEDTKYELLPPPLPRPKLNEDITTLPRDSSSSRAPSSKKPNFCLETSFEATQSVPANLDTNHDDAQASASNVETHLSEFNMAMYKLEDGSRTYSGRVMRRKSFVQSSYEKLSRQFKDDTEILIRM